MTFIGQYVSPFRILMRDEQPRVGLGAKGSDVMLYAGFRPWQGAEIWINPEIDQGFASAISMASPDL